MESKKINQLATELTPALSDLTIIGDPTTGISKKITLSQMASLFTGTVEEYPDVASFPLVGVADTIYIALDTNVLYRWDTTLTSYVELSPNIINSLVFNDANGFDGTISLVGSVATLTITTALTQGSVGFIGASGALVQDNANFFWDDTNNRLGIGTNAPTTAIDVFGSGIIGRLNGTSTNNSFLGFASGGTNKWSIGNVQSDHRFRIYSEANTSELVSVLQTGEFGIGIANPTTKLHIDGGASALIANLDANVSVAKSISFRSDNSNRINLEVSGTESGSNAGANFFLRAYSDAGALLNTPLTITRATGAATFASSVTNAGLIFNTNDSVFSTAGSITKHATVGLVIKGVTGSVFDFSLYSANETALITNPTGTTNIAFNAANINLKGTNLLIGTGTDNNKGGKIQIIQSNTNTNGIDIKGTELTSSHWGTFSNSTYFAQNYYFNGSQNADDSTYGQTAIVMGTSTTAGSGSIDFDLSDAGASSPGVKMRLTSYGILDFNGNSVISSSNDKFAMGINSTSYAWIQSFGGRQLILNGSGNNVGINTTNALSKLQIGTPVLYTGSGYTFAMSNGGTDFLITLNTAQVGSSTTFYSSTDYYFNRSGPSSTGIITAFGFNNISDYRMKENLSSYNPFDIINNIKTYKYDMIDTKETQYGVLAHEVQEILPHIVVGVKDGDRLQSVDYSKIVPILIKGIQELKSELNELKAK